MPEVILRAIGGLAGPTRTPAVGQPLVDRDDNEMHAHQAEGQAVTQAA